MHTFFKHITFCLSLLSLLVVTHLAYPQNYPVDCRVLLSPPFSGQMSEIVSSPLKFKVQLLLKDLTKPSVEVSLRIRLKGQGVWLENPEGFINSQPITLTPGIPKTLSALELAENFSPQNMEVQGIDYTQLLNGLALPFGFYEWEVVAIEHYRFRQVSNVGTARFYIQNNYPPLLNMPTDGNIVTATTPQNILFSWTPRHITPALGSGGLLYHLYLYEVPYGEDPSVVINSATPYMQELLSDKPNFLYGPTGLPLTEGKRYAWQVRVESLNGEIGFFNNGYSDIKSFVYGHLPCLPSTNLQAKVDADDGSVQLSWDAPSDALSYKLAYFTLPDGLKTEKSVLSTEHLLIQQSVGYQYKWEVKTVCKQAESQTTVSDFEIIKTPTEEETWESDPELTYEPESPMEPDPEVIKTSENPQEDVNDSKTTEEELTNLLNTQTKIYIPAEGKELPDNLPKQLSVLPANATIEQMQEVLKTKKPTCAGITASYSCGNHDNVPQYNGTLVPVNAGDEIAMNSMVLSVVSIDGAGNGEGLIKVPMMNNIKLGVTLSGIQVAEGGCVVAGRAELSGVNASLLTDKQRVALEKAYAAYNQILDVAYENAGAIAETYNSLTDLYEKIAEKTQAILVKVNEGKKVSKSELKALAAMKQKAKEGIDKQIAYFTKKFGSEGSEEIIKMVNLASQSCICEAYTETFEPKKGPNSKIEEWLIYDEDCKKCLEEDKKRQQEMAKLAKEFEEKLKAIKDKKMECGCGWNSFNTIWQSLAANGDCEEIAAKMNKLREDFKDNLYSTIELFKKLEGQVMIGENCIDKFSIAISNNAGMDVTSIPRDEYNEPNREINNNRLELYNDRTKNPQRYLTIKTDNNDQAKLVEGWLFSGVTEEEVVETNAIFPITGKQLNQIFKTTPIKQCETVARIINKYSNKYGLTNAERMSHFIGQIGAETNLNQLKELTYSENNIENSGFATTTRKYKGKKVLKYCDLFEGYEAISTNSCPFPYCEPPLYEGTTGLKVKDKYVKSTALFDYVYACRMDNGTIDSKDGSRFRGRGFMQLTGHYNYQKMLQDKWDRVHGKGNKDFMCRSAECDKNLDMIADDLDMAMQTALTFWADAKANDLADEVDDGSIAKITEEINGKDNGIKYRKLYTKKAYKTLKK